MQLPEKLKERVGLWLMTAEYGHQIIVAQALKRTPRTLRLWKAKAQKKIKKKSGRPRQKVNPKEKLIIEKEWERQGYPGSRPVIQALPKVRVRVVREVIKDLKSKRKKRRDKTIKAVRKSIRVKEAGTVLAMDGTTKKRGDDYLIYRDRGSLSVNAEKCGGPLRTHNILRVLTKLKSEKKLPLVYCTDNGAPLCSKAIESFLEKNYIIHLKNLPHTPQHNGSCENAVREFKELFSEILDLKVVTQTLNTNRMRASLNWQTSCEFEKSNTKTFTPKERMKFYANTKANIKNALIGINNAKEKRLREREEILKTMENFSLITITRGSQSRESKAEVIT